MSYVGACLCGAITVTITGELTDQTLCHCKDCRRTSGSAFSSNLLVPENDVKIEGPVGTYKSPALSGNTVTRIFCSICGSAIAHTSVGLGGKHALQTGIFPDFIHVPIVTELFTKDRWNGIPPIAGAAQFNTMN
ncbi:hypothetical protein AX16_003094 [Volvariella volvacea WC 439]|nr:hypothetical protein AX16_003094 [Volvariella volvacea WC 439]